MKQVVQNVLRNQFGVEVRRATKSPKEEPIPLVNKHGLRLVHFYELIKKIENIPGDIVECGVGWGRSLYAFSLFTSTLNQGKKIIGYDSFEGFPEPTQEDKPERFSVKKGHYSTNKESVINHLLKSGISKDFIQSNITLIKGFFQDSLKNYNGEPIALLHLDVDLYDSYKVCLEYLYPYVSKGGIIAFDEYQENEKYPGGKKAIDEFFNGRNTIYKSAIVDRYYAIKDTD